MNKFGPHEAVHLDGSPIDWSRPPRPHTKVKWSKPTDDQGTMFGSFRTICAFNRMNNVAVRKFGIGQGVTIIQPPFNTTVDASKGTHDEDACADWFIAGLDSWWAMQRMGRALGFGCWYRHKPKFGNHIHGFPLPPRPEGTSASEGFQRGQFKVGTFVDGGLSTKGSLVASSQIADYYAHAFGLAGQHVAGSDDSWFPTNIRATIFDLDAYVQRRANA